MCGITSPAHRVGRAKPGKGFRDGRRVCPLLRHMYQAKRGLTGSWEASEATQDGILPSPSHGTAAVRTGFQAPQALTAGAASSAAPGSPDKRLAGARGGGRPGNDLARARHPWVGMSSCRSGSRGARPAPHFVTRHEIENPAGAGLGQARSRTDGGSK
ncbi:hypothetical protein XCVa0002 (plasmid) [Xanthomonas euvesicatoria pv. vesicatoria str. 85-10]|uniref:Uncharacterized protein n=2 Tax=Xanthomonas euvesicatoria TaxID=456327 RepID=Q3C0H0_XANE5|nr:ORF2 [Xanthomonas euvesicatoria]CAJ19747.1 hypothetical protein XCVa0002 [Xanthomonas euvesicatoria pv. vesicatoria str. 85-10]